MLPDFVVLKREINEVLNLFMRRRFQYYCTGIQDIPKEQLFEGTGMSIHRASGDVDKSSFIQNSTEFSISYDEVPGLSLNDVLDKLDKAAKNMSDQVQKTFYLKMNEDLDRMGRTVDQKGKPFTADTILEALKSIHIDFDKDGKHHGLELHTAPQLQDAVRKAFADLEADPDLKRRHEELMIQKREEYRAREASRRLVG
ncbi:hypothetical protein KI809_04985 [Geobacter pelophilus]|uniref:Uncharacterized protein n=1 Tax=Geoanaerobacter pelophilus TaxID=60036 RepID=A0AAW4L765_9BACT|nr:hypothetical protein [Geoanaerobacter pelophilus]MBT0663652.1 hypothetical protein [Geoanaerobacter pelophilus]